MGMVVIILIYIDLNKCFWSMVKAKSILLAVNVPLWTTWMTVFISVSDGIEYESFCLLEITPDFVGFLLMCFVFCRVGSSSRSRSRSPDDVGQVKFITSFGAESDEEGASGAVQGPSLPPTAAKSDRSSVNDSHSDTFRHQPWSVFSSHCYLLHTAQSQL